MMETVEVCNPKDPRDMWDWFCPICGCVNLAVDTICVACGEEVKIILPVSYGWTSSKKEEEEDEKE
jgi:hypothetical protein